MELKFISSKISSGWLNPSYINTKTMNADILISSKYAKGRLLDIGCGTKPYYSIFKDIVDKYVGLENPILTKVTPSGIGKRELDTNGLIQITEKEKRPVLFGNGQNLPFKSESFDTVLCTEVIEHIPEPQKIMSEISRVLRKNGVLILTAPFVIGHHQQPYDYYRFTKYGLSYLSKTNGLEPIVIKPHHGFLALLGLLFSSCLYFNFCRTKSGKQLFLLYPFILPICAIIQLFFFGLDKIKRIEGTTKGHLLVARKV